MPEDNGLPDWAHPDIYGRMWTVRELTEALMALGWTPSTVDPSTTTLVDKEITTEHEDGTTTVEYVTVEELGQPLTRSFAWIDPKGEYAPLRLSRDLDARAAPHAAACVIVAMARG